MFTTSDKVRDVNPGKVASFVGNQPLQSGDYAIVGMTLREFKDKRTNKTISFYVLVLARVDKDNKITAQVDTISVKQLASPVPELDTDGNAHHNTGDFQKKLAGLFDGVRTLSQVTLQAVKNFERRKFSVKVTTYNKISRNGDIVMGAKYESDINTDSERLDMSDDVSEKIGKMFSNPIYTADSEKILTFAANVSIKKPNL